MADSQNKFYVYLHRRASDDKVFYVGKGSNKRAWRVSGRNKKWNNTYLKHGLKVEIVFESLCESEAFQIEIDTIKEMNYFYPDTICNLTEGGEGAAGYYWTEEAKDRQSLLRQGTKQSEQTKIRKSKSLLKTLIDGNSDNIDKTVYQFLELKSGIIYSGTRVQMSNKLGISSSATYKLIKNKGNSIKGFALLRPEETIDQCIDRCKNRPIRKDSGERYHNKRYNAVLCFAGADGTCFWATQEVFENKIGKSLVNIVNRDRRFSNGWSVLKDLNNGQ
jgi:hypothetical protein